MTISTYFGMPRYSYYLRKLYEEFEHSDILGDKFYFPEKDGSGHIKNVFLEEEFCIRFFNFSLCKDNFFHWYLHEESVSSLLQLVITFDEDLSSNDHGEYGLLDNFVSATIHNSDSLHPEWIAGKTKVQRIMFLFTWDWLKENFAEAYERTEEIMKKLDRDNMPRNFMESMGEKFYDTAKEIAVEMQQIKFAPLHVKGKSLMLLNQFFDKLTTDEEEITDKRKSLHYDSVLQVEKKLMQHLHESLPSIESLAAEVNLSPSTLQRHFKVIFEKNIYHYYLEKKFIVGKELIESGSKSVSEVAYSLGYQKINSFSKIFKKIFGVLPKDYQ